MEPTKTGFLYNNKEGFKFPKGKLFLDEKEFQEALETGWDTGPADKAKREREKAKAEKEAEEAKEEKGKPGRPKGKQ